MNWETVSACGALCGALFIGLSVIYLALQLHHNTRTTRAEALGSALGVHVTQIAQLTESAAAARLFRKFAGGFDSLSLDERGMIMCAMLERLVSFNQVIDFHGAGLLEDEEFQAIKNTYVSILRTAGGREWWSLYKHMTPPWLESYIANAIDDAAIRCKPYDQELPWLFADADAASENKEDRAGLAVLGSVSLSARTDAESLHHVRIR